MLVLNGSPHINGDTEYIIEKLKEAITIKCDISNENDVLIVIEQIEKNDVLINCTGIFESYYVEKKIEKKV